MPPKHSIYRTIELPSTLTISLYVYIRNEKFKGIIISEYTSKLTILRHFLKKKIPLDMYICPLNPQQVLAATLALFLCKK